MQKDQGVEVAVELVYPHIHRIIIKAYNLEQSGNKWGLLWPVFFNYRYKDIFMPQTLPKVQKVPASTVSTMSLQDMLQERWSFSGVPHHQFMPHVASYQCSPVCVATETVLAKMTCSWQQKLLKSYSV